MFANYSENIITNGFLGFFRYALVIIQLLIWKKMIHIFNVKNNNKNSQLQYVKKLFETNKKNFSRSKPIIGRKLLSIQRKLELLVSNNFFTYCIVRRNISIWLENFSYIRPCSNNWKIVYSVGSSKKSSPHCQTRNKSVIL